MNEELSIGTDIACASDVTSVSASDAGENILDNMKHLSVDPENVAQFKEQLNSKSQSKKTESTSTAEGKTEHNTSENSVTKPQSSDERTFFGNNSKKELFASGKSPRPSKNQNTDGFIKDFHEKPVKFDINSQSSALKTAGGAVASNVTREEHIALQSSFFEAPDVSREPVNNPKELRNTFTGAETLPTDTPLRNTAGENKASLSAGVSQSHSDLPQPSPKLKSPATLLRELQTPTASTETRASGTSNAASTSISERASEAVTEEPSSGIPSAETLLTPENRTTLHSTTTPIFGTTPSLTDTFAEEKTVTLNASTRSSDGSNTVTNASATKPTETVRRNVPETSTPLSKTDNTASISDPLSGTKTRGHPRSFESASEPHRTAVIDTIPFLRTSNENISPVQEPTAAQASKSHAALIAQQIRDHILDRILVSSSALNKQQTVTVQLSPRLLQDTEVQFTQNGASLDIRLVSQNKESVHFLQQHQADLQTYLQGELKTYRAISVRVPSSQASAELSQPHDGRSRNRFDYQSADEEETT